MKAVIVNGNMRKGSTWNCMDQVIRELGKYEPVERVEFYLPKDMPDHCLGCFSCFYRGEENCPHSHFTQPIVKEFLEADLIVLTSPVYGMDVSGQMKTFIDHLCYMWMSHRPDPNMFNKIGLSISTTAGAGLGHTTKTMRNSLKFWGVKRIYSFKISSSAMKWSDVTEKRRAKIEKISKVIASKIYKAFKNRDKLSNPIFRSIFFKMMKGMQTKNNWNLKDRDYWESKGWLDGTNPF